MRAATEQEREKALYLACGYGGAVVGGKRRRTPGGQTRVRESRAAVRCSSLRHHPFPSIRVFYFSSALRPYIDMADVASGSTERSVQVKLVLLGG